MPFLRFHAVDKKRLALVSERMTDRIQQVVKCPRETIVLEVIHSDYVIDGGEPCEWPFVGVAWFERPSELQREVATIIYEELKAAGYKNSDVHFESLTPRNYYENGKSLESL